MRRVLLLLAAAGALAACATAPALRGEVVRRVIASTVQLQSEREGGVRRAASGVVLASDGPTRRSWILTAGHFVEPLVGQTITVAAQGRGPRRRASVVASSRDPDLAVLLAEGPGLPPIRIRDRAELGDGVWVVTYPWGKAATVAGGIVSQLDAPDGGMAGGPTLVDVSVSYGASGGGVFDAVSGDLIALVEGYRTARITLPRDPTASVQVPVAGETMVIPASAIARFLIGAGLSSLLPEGARDGATPSGR